MVVQDRFHYGTTRDRAMQTMGSMLTQEFPFVIILRIIHYLEVNWNTAVKNMSGTGDLGGVMGIHYRFVVVCLGRSSTTLRRSNQQRF
jgi:hypothetical protein